MESIVPSPLPFSLIVSISLSLRVSLYHCQGTGEQLNVQQRKRKYIRDAVFTSISAVVLGYRRIALLICFSFNVVAITLCYYSKSI